ncbi:MAG: DegT/DnrJ/EryC1/StrS aminotransferase family protein [Clostridia bacterium]|nr:DegT/DnrJ/EryC1/StrS aminotransferase family protein [Clostridia bacterium]
MEFRDLKKQYAVLKNKIDKSVLDVMASGGYIMGKPVTELEISLAEYVGSKHCVSCANGTDALSLALMAMGIGSGDCVFVPDFTFFATAEVVSFAGAYPVFVDVDRDTFNIDSAKLDEAVRRVKSEGKYIPKAVIAVDLFGLPANYQEIRKVADKYGLYVIEDAAQGFGGSINGKKACSFGDISTTSFFPAKPLGCYGDGGAVFTDNDEWASIMTSLKYHGKGSYKYDNVRIGMNSRLDTIQAAILKPKFDAFKEYELDSVNEFARTYSSMLAGYVKIPQIPEGFYSSWAQYTITLENQEQRDSLQMYLKERGIPSTVYYPRAMHEQTAFSDVASDVSSLQISKILSETVLSLPMHPYMEQEDIEYICNSIQEFIRSR